MNPLDEYPQVRKFLYLIQWLVNGVLVVAGAIFLAQQRSLDSLPEWYVITTAVAPVLWTYLGITAQTNVREDPPPPGA
jgi:hypothetical protein